MKLPEIETRRLRLRPARTADVDALHRIWTEPQVRRFLFDAVEIDRETAAGFVARSEDLFRRRGCGLFVLTESPGGPPVGFAGYLLLDKHPSPDPELIYGIDPPQQRGGLAVEATRALIRFGVEQLGLDRVVASTDAPNLASVGVMQRAGLRFWKREPGSNGIEQIFYSIRAPDFAPDDAPYELRFEDQSTA